MQSSAYRLGRRLPSFAQIKRVDLSKYMTEEQKKFRESLQAVSGGLTTGLDDNGAAGTGSDNGLIKKGLFASLLYGSQQTRDEQKEIEHSYSKTLMRGKYVHEITIHKTLPSKSGDYLDLVTEIYPKIAGDAKNQVHLVGSWRTVIGDMDTFVHIWEYNGYPGFHLTQNLIHQNEFYLDYLLELRNYLRSRESSIVQEFSFWGGTASPRELGGIFELRTYDIQAGKLLEWESHWRKGLECRRQVMEPVGAWFAQLGKLNRVHHLWQFADLEHRKLSREKCWELPGWAETTHETVKLINSMESTILVPLSFSPLK